MANSYAGKAGSGDALSILSKAGLTQNMAENDAGVRDFTSDFQFNADPDLSTRPLGQQAQLPHITQLLPRYRTTATNKWTNIQTSGALQKYQIPTDATNLVIKMDKDRLNSGRPPLTMDQTVAALKAAKNRAPVTQVEPRQAGDVLGNIYKDATGIFGSVLRLPQAVGREILAVPEIPKVWENDKTSFGEKVHETPILNLIPGVNTAANLTEGKKGLEDIATHPLMTALDILPWVEKGSEFTGAGKLAEETRLAEGTKAAPRPMKAAALYKVENAPVLDADFNPVLDPETGAPVTQPKLIRNPIGEALARFTDESGVGSGISQRFGSRVREAAYSSNRLSAGANQILTGTGRLPKWAGEAGNLARQWSDIDRQYNLTPEQKVLAADIGTTWDPGDAKQRAALDANPDVERYLNDVRTMANKDAQLLAPPIEQIVTKKGKIPADSPHLLATYDEEVYNPKQAAKLYSRERAADRAEAALTTIKKGASHSILTRLVEEGSKPGADPRLLDVAQHIQDGNYKEARNVFSSLTARKVGLGESETRAVGLSKNPNDLEFPLPGGQFQIREAGNINKALKEAVEKRKLHEELVDTTPPARYGDWIVKRVGKEIQAKIESEHPDVEAEWLAKTINKRDWSDLVQRNLTSQKELDSYAKEIGQSWKQMRQLGVDPIFMHHVQESSVGAMAWPRILPQINEPSFARERAWSFQPYVPDYGVSMHHMGMEMVRRAGQEQFVDNLVRSMGVGGEDLAARFKHRIEKFGEEDARRNNTTATNAILSQGWGKFDPEKMVGYRSARWADLEGKDIWLPKPVLKAIEDMRTPPADNLLNRVTAPIMKPFRASVLTLSPRFLANTLLGGAIESSVANPNGLRFMKQAWDLTRGNTEEFAVGKGKGTNMFAPDDYYATQNQTNMQQAELHDIQTKTGKTLAKWWNESQARKELGQTAGKWWSKPLQIHNFAENMYRSMALLGETDSALRKGMTPDVAIKEGVRAMERVLPQWESLTPFERSIVRSAFPFYTWTQHILHFVSTLPLDHPTRVAVVSNLVRTQLDDEKSGWPQVFRSMLMLGSPDSKGDQTALQLNGGNPFRDVGNFMTLGGFMAGVNPLLSTAMQSLGIEEGVADLYPDTHYNPDTGKMEADTGNPILNLVHNTIPQSDWIAHVLGINEDFEAMQKTNPDAAYRRFLSDLGLPTFARTVHLPKEAAARELSIYKAMMADRSAGLRSGNRAQIEQWPDQKAYVRQLLKLSPKELQPYDSEANGPTPSQSNPAYRNQVAALSVTPHPL